MEALLVGIVVDIVLALAWAGFRKLYLSVRDHYRVKNDVDFNQGNHKWHPEVDKKEIDDEVQKAVDKLVPTLAKKITNMAGRSYESIHGEPGGISNGTGGKKLRLSKEPPTRWFGEQQPLYMTLGPYNGVTMQNIDEATPNSSMGPLSYDMAFDHLMGDKPKEPDKNDRPAMIAEKYQAHLNYVREVTKAMEEWGKIPVPSSIRFKMTQAETVDDLLNAEDEYHKYVMEQRKEDEEPYMFMLDSCGGEIDREILY